MFLWGIFICLCSHVIYDMIKESVETNVPLISRLRNDKYNFLAIVYKEIMNERLSNKTDEEIFNNIKSMFDNHSFLFLQNYSINKQYLDSVAFVEKIVRNKGLLFGYVATPSFGKKEMKKLEELIAKDECEKSARSKIQAILIDKTTQNIDTIMEYLHRRLKKEFFIQDPHEPDRRIFSGENTFSIYEIGKGIIFESGTKQKDYFAAIKSLEKIYPDMDLPNSLGHAGDRNYWSSDYKERREAIIADMKMIIRKR